MHRHIFRQLFITTSELNEHRDATVAVNITTDDTVVSCNDSNTTNRDVFTDLLNQGLASVLDFATGNRGNIVSLQFDGFIHNLRDEACEIFIASNKVGFAVYFTDHTGLTVRRDSHRNNAISCRTTRFLRRLHTT